jgi:pyridoxal phosphate enzyme (YggS family)
VTQITKNLEDLARRIGAAAAAAAGRNENEVSILAVSKRHTPEAIRLAHDAGLRLMGENYVQEALQKIPLFGNDIEWHFIGRIQSNKTRAIAENFDWVQTVNSEQTAHRLNDQRPEKLGPLNICVQVCMDQDSEHGGVMPAGVAPLCAYIEELPRLKLRGLMCIPLPAETMEEQRAPFRQMRELFEQLAGQGHRMDTLSMGMTGDLEAAVAEGSTMVRIGTALFGPRPS